jgi:hypothetical protein
MFIMIIMPSAVRGHPPAARRPRSDDLLARAGAVTWGARYRPKEKPRDWRGIAVGTLVNQERASMTVHRGRNEAPSGLRRGGD